LTVVFGDGEFGELAPVVKPVAPKYGHAICSLQNAYFTYQGKKAILIQNSWGCYDKKTEILTNKGWKLFKDLDNNEIVATLNPTTQELEYQQIEARQIYDYDGLLWHYQLRDIDLLVTPNHRLYIKPYQKNKRLGTCKS